MNFALSWNEFYDGTNDSYSKDDFSNPHCYYISEIISSEGARFINFTDDPETSIKILIESSKFFSNNLGETPNCYDDRAIGANIYINAKLNVVQNKICSYNCSINSYGQHCFIFTRSPIKLYKNYNYLSSYTDLGQQGMGYSPLLHGQGEVLIRNTNISNCRTFEHSGLYIESVYFPGNIFQTSLINNSASNDFCVDCYCSKQYSYIKTNFLENKVSNHLIVISCASTLSIIDSIIKNNDVQNTFSITNKAINIIHSLVELKGDSYNINTVSSSTNLFENVFTFTYACKCCSSYIISKRRRVKYMEFLLSISKCISFSNFESSTKIFTV